jgi:hypothetical protein
LPKTDGPVFYSGSVIDEEKIVQLTPGSQFSDDQVKEDKESDNAKADVDHEATVATAGPDHIVQSVHCPSKQAGNSQWLFRQNTQNYDSDTVLGLDTLCMKPLLKKKAQYS